MTSNNYSVPDESSDESDELNEHVHDPGDPDGVFAAERHQHWQEEHPVPDRTPEATYRPKRIWLKVLVVVVILAGAAFGSFWLGSHEADKGQTTPTTTSSTTAHSSGGSQGEPVVTATKHYDSTNYTLGFDYPKTWTISDTTTKLTVTSPAMQMATADGEKTGVLVVVTFQNPTPTIMGFPSAGAVAVLASDHLTYKQPSTIQRAQTYLSYLSYGAANGLDAVYVTGDNGYQQGQLVPMSDITSGNPIIGVTFDSCPDENCSSSKPVTLSASAWQSSAASKDVVSLLESIVLES
ncbi:MAG TPA: hypothetical protein VMB52_02100 [Verrucomicrobiae bacterium]|nr:hypothetical protein [Verrucomicrobiae bacterium]